MEKMETNIRVIKQDVKLLEITVLRATGVTVSNISDKFDIPDPYVILRNINSPTGKQKTTVKDDDVNPVWNEKFSFHLNGDKKNTLVLLMKDRNIAVPDSTVGEGTVELDHLPVNETTYKVVSINKKTDLYIKLHIKTRFSHELCDDEREFIEKRRQKIFQKMLAIFPKDKAPKSLEEVPTIAIIGSGGGYRAACGFCGALCALEESGILDCATYIAALSGSAWYTSTLYSHEGWPHNRSCKDIRKYLARKFNATFRSHVKQFEFNAALKAKRLSGQLVSMTDLVGMFLGEALLQNKESRFSNQTIKLETGKAPLLLCTALVVQKEVSAEILSEWIEFSPYEFGSAKYGIFGRMSDFGSKFYKGHVVTKYEESPLHYLQGIWGSASSILLNRVLGEDNDKLKKNPTAKQVREYFMNNEMDLVGEGDNDVEEFENNIEYLPKEKKQHRAWKQMRKQVRLEKGGLRRTTAVRYTQTTRKGSDSPAGSPETAMKMSVNVKNNNKVKSEQYKGWRQDTLVDQDTELVYSSAEEGPEDKIKKTSWLKDILTPGKIFKTRQGRAAEVFNMFRGLKIAVEKGGLVDTTVTCSAKTMCLVDSGLAYNSPYPVVIRPERKVDLIISFDFSIRDHDEGSSPSGPPFDELLKAEKWARSNHMPFPPIAGNPITKETEIQECYVFEDPDDPLCPTIIHFVIINKTFKDYREPGLPRKRPEEKTFADFAIFDDPAHPYGSFSLEFSPTKFNRLHDLMEYNTLNNIDVVKDKIAELVKSRSCSSATEMLTIGLV